MRDVNSVIIIDFFLLIFIIILYFILFFFVVIHQDQSLTTVQFEIGVYELYFTETHQSNISVS